MDQHEQCGLLINGVPLDTYGGAALLNYSVGDTEINNNTYQGVNRSTWHLLKSIYGLRNIKITVVFTGETRRDASLQRSMFNQAVFGKSEIYISDDGFFYSVSLEKAGAEILLGEGSRETKIKSEYQFRGIRHDPLVTESVPASGTLFCRSTVPFTDCKMTVTVGATASSYSLGGATFGAVTAGDVLVFDGINCIITKNGANAAASVSWTDFPRLVPGSNAIGALDAVTVEYFPTFL